MCDQTLTDAVKGLCEDCQGVFTYVGAPRCMKCGKHIERADKELCLDCERFPKAYDGGVSLYEYRSIEQSIIAFKNHNRQEYSKYFVAQMSQHLGDVIRSYRADAIVPIPLSLSKYKARGYNQAELLGRGLSKELGIPFWDDYLCRKNVGKEQKILSFDERQNNIKKAFHIVQNSVKLKTVILVDDVYTTGATINAAAQVLKAGGVEKVYFVTLATGSMTQGV